MVIATSLGLRGPKLEVHEIAGLISERSGPGLNVFVGKQKAVEILGDLKSSLAAVEVSW